MGKIDVAILKKRMAKAIKELNEATEAYDKGQPIMTDAEWDAMYFALEDAEKAYGITLPDSPTVKVHFDSKVSELPKKIHSHEMLSLAKTKSIDEAREFLSGKPYLAMCKMDGLTCSLRYENGHLICAETRGDGFVGEDITHNAMVIRSIPKHINYKETLVVDGEIISTHRNFEQFSKDYKNPRNFAAGSIRLLDSAECETRGLDFVVWDVIEGFEEKEFLNEKLGEVERLGFTVVPYAMYTDFNEVILEQVRTWANLNSYPIDGVVIKFNELEYSKSLGKTAHHFNNALAYKFFDEIAYTTLKDIEWTMGRTGVLTPVAILEPIEMDGAVIERASLHNISVMTEIMGGAFKGQKVQVYRANMIIPQILRGEDPESVNVELIQIPDICPICGGQAAVKKSESGVLNLYCENLQCEGKLINRLNHFCGKKGLDIKGLSKATLEKLINQGWIEDLDDLFTLRHVQYFWKQLPGFGEKSVEKILNAIEVSRHTTLDCVLSSIGIPFVGKTVSKDLANRFKTYEAFRKAIDEGFDFSQINGYGPEITKSLLTFNYGELDGLVKNWLYLDEVEEETTENRLEGVTFVITGKLTHWKNRDALKDVIENLGGKVTGSVTKNTDFLINNDINSNSAKNKKAKELEVDIITEEDFIKRFDL